MSLKKYIRVGADGVVQASVMRSDNYAPRGFIEVTDPEQKRLVSGNLGGLLYCDGRLTEKCMVKLVADKLEFVVGAGDMVTVSITDVPGAVEHVKILVNRREALLAVGETLEVTSDTAGAILVRVADAQPVRGNSLVLLAKEAE